MAVNLINFNEWIFGNDEYSSNRFFSELFKNTLKESDDCKIRNINDLDKIDHAYIMKDYHYNSSKSCDDLKSDVKLNYVNKIFCSKYIDWYIIKPLGTNGCASFRDYFAIYLPNTEKFDEVKNSLVDYNQPCFSCNYLHITDMSDGKQSDLFIGGLNQPEPPCMYEGEHNWCWDLYNEDCLEIYFAECKKCGIQRKKIIGDTRSIQWNKNHGWRYLKPTINKSSILL